eukprot:scaffold18597_cov63-Phaeocystis_antarctica.AAC.5
MSTLASRSVASTLVAPSLAAVIAPKPVPEPSSSTCLPSQKGAPSASMYRLSTMPQPHTALPVEDSHMFALVIVCLISSGGAPGLQKTRRGSSEQSFQSLTSLNSGYSASVHEGESAFRGSYAGWSSRTAETAICGTSSRPR